MKEKIFKYFKTIFISILIINFVVSFIACISNISKYLIPATITKYPTETTLLETGKAIEENLTELTDDLKSTYGEEYPALGIAYYRSINHYSTVSLIQNFIFSLIAGFGLGNIIFIIWMTKLPVNKKLAFLIIALFVVGFFVSLSDVLTFIANSEKIKFSMSEIFWNMEVAGIPYIIVSIFTYVAHYVYTVYNDIRNS